MAGRLGLSTPWARQYLPADKRSAVVEAIPDGCTLGVSAQRKPGDWSLWLIADGIQTPIWQVRVRDHDLQRACLRTLEFNRPSLVWCSWCEAPSVIEIEGEAYCARHQPAREEAA